MFNKSNGLHFNVKFVSLTLIYDLYLAKIFNYLMFNYKMEI